MIHTDNGKVPLKEAQRIHKRGGLDYSPIKDNSIRQKIIARVVHYIAPIPTGES